MSTATSPPKIFVTLRIERSASLIAFPAVNEFIQGPFWLLAKIFVFLFVYVWMRGTLPRFRYDQLMSFGWKLLLPVSLANVVITAFVILLRGH